MHLQAQAVQCDSGLIFWCVTKRKSSQNCKAEEAGFAEKYMKHILQNSSEKLKFASHEQDLNNAYEFYDIKRQAGKDTERQRGGGGSPLNFIFTLKLII